MFRTLCILYSWKVKQTTVVPEIDNELTIIQFEKCTSKNFKKSLYFWTCLRLQKTNIRNILKKMCNMWLSMFLKLISDKSYIFDIIRKLIWIAQANNDFNLWKKDHYKDIEREKKWHTNWSESHICVLCPIQFFSSLLKSVNTLSTSSCSHMVP